MPKLPAKTAQRAARETPREQDRRETNAERLDHTPVVFPRACDEDVTILGVDPGEHHVGLAVGSRNVVPALAADDHAWAVEAPGWRVYDVAEMEPWPFVKWFRSNIQHFDIVTIEKFTLYPDKLKEQIGSEMPTSKLIGWVENTVRLWNEEFIVSGPAKGRPEIELQSHPAQIHKGTASVLRHKGIGLVSPKSPDHARSAELHLWHTLIRSGLVEGVVLA